MNVNPFVVHRDDAQPFTTKDGSTIREILASRVAPGVIRNQSLAEATLLPGSVTQAHYHPVSEEIYYVLSGTGMMFTGDPETPTKPWNSQMVTKGNAVAIAPGVPHQISNTGSDDLVFLCCCAPEYTHEDTIFVDKP